MWGLDGVLNAEEEQEKAPKLYDEEREIVWEQMRNRKPANPKQAYGDKKIAVHLVPPAALLYLGMAMKEGARKYGAYNWRESKVESMTYVGAALRHILQYLDGEDIDPDTGEAEVPHLAAAMACMAIAADATEGGFLVDNRPTAGPASKIIQERQL